MCPHSAPAHLHVWTAFPQCSRIKYKGVIWHFQESLLQAAASDLFPPNCTFLEKSFYCDFLLLLRSPRSPPIAFPLALSVFRFPLLPPFSAALGHTRSLALVTSKYSFPPHLSLSFSLLTLNTNRWPTAPHCLPLSHDPLTSSCFSCWRRQLSKCLCEELLSFSLSPDQFPKWTLWHVLKYSRWWAK